MKVFRGTDKIEFDKKSVITVGTFDGVHLGHQKILKDLVSIGRSKNLRSVLVTLHPHPKLVLSKEENPKVEIITTLEERFEILEQIGIDAVWVIDFTKEFSQNSGEDFIRNYLIEMCGFEHILIGYDHMFGKDRSGSIELLKNLQNEFDYKLEQIEALQDEDVVISSTKIRNAILSGKIALANSMLGRNFSVEGEVIHGEKRGRDLGYPTANIKPDSKHKILPTNGIYVVKSNIDDKEYFGMANIGLRPTFGDLNMPLTEVFYFDLDQDLYGKRLKVEFLEFVREERKFKVLEELVEAMKDDETFSLEFIKNYKIFKKQNPTIFM